MTTTSHGSPGSGAAVPPLRREVLQDARIEASSRERAQQARPETLNGGIVDGGFWQGLRQRGIAQQIDVTERDAHTAGSRETRLFDFQYVRFRAIDQIACHAAVAVQALIRGEIRARSIERGVQHADRLDRREPRVIGLLCIADDARAQG